MTSPLLKNSPAPSVQKPVSRNPVWLILAFLIPMIAMWIGFALCGVRPFAIPIEGLLKFLTNEGAQNQMLWSDLREQYYPFLQEFHERVRSGESLLWSWDGGMGTDYISLIAYYVASPLNLITLFFPTAMLREVMTVLLTVKIGCAGLFFGLMIKNIFRRNDVSLTAFSWMYAFSSFIMGYYWDTIWMDTVALLPLVFLGLYKLVTEGKFRLYVIALALAVLSNYYLGAFVCYFCVIAFFAIAAIRQVYGREFLSRLGQFAGCSLLGGGLTAFLLLHTGLSLMNTDSAASGGIQQLDFYDSYTEVVGNMLAFNNPTAMSGLPNLYCGILPLLLLVVYLRSKKISLEDKIINAVFLVFFIFSSNFNLLDFILHGFRFPNMLPGRYTFLISFVLLLIGYRGFLLLKDMTAADLYGMAALSIVMVGISCFSLGTEKTMANIVLISAYLLFFFLYERRFLRKRAFTVFLCLLITGEMCASLTLSMDTVGKTNYYGYPYRYEEIKQLNETLEEMDPSFWRTEFHCRYYLNDGAMYRFRGVNQFSSTANRNVTKFLSAISFTTGANSYYYNFSSPVNNALLGLKYIIARDGDLIGGTKTQWYYGQEGEQDHGDLQIYRNTAYLGAGFMVNEAVENMEYTNSPFQVQNRLFQGLTGSSESIFFSRKPDSYESYNFEEFEQQGSEYVFSTRSSEGVLDLNYTAASTGTYYAYMCIGGGGDVEVTVNPGTENAKYYQHPVASLRYIAPVCEVTAGDKIRIRITTGADKKNCNISCYLYYFNENNFDEGWATLTDETWEPSDFSDTHLKGDITVKQDGLFCTVIPYSEDWTLYVDGVKTETRRVLGGDVVKNDTVDSRVEGPYIGAYLTEGTHTVELRYTPKGLIPGIGISVASLVTLLVLAFVYPKGFPVLKKKNRPVPAEPLPEPEENDLSDQGDHKKEP